MRENKFTVFVKKLVQFLDAKMKRETVERFDYGFLVIVSFGRNGVG
jgi:hypothetical protein